MIDAKGEDATDEEHTLSAMMRLTAAAARVAGTRGEGGDRRLRTHVGRAHARSPGSVDGDHPRLRRRRRRVRRDDARGETLSRGERDEMTKRRDERDGRDERRGYHRGWRRTPSSVEGDSRDVSRETPRGRGCKKKGPEVLRLDPSSSSLASILDSIPSSSLARNLASIFVSRPSEDVDEHDGASVSVVGDGARLDHRPAQRTRPLSLEPLPHALLAEHVSAPQLRGISEPLLADAALAARSATSAGSAGTPCLASASRNARHAPTTRAIHSREF